MVFIALTKGLCRIPNVQAGADLLFRMTWRLTKSMFSFEFFFSVLVTSATLVYTDMHCYTICSGLLRSSFLYTYTFHCMLCYLSYVRYDILCFAMLRFAILWYLCYIVQCYPTLCYGMLCFLVLYAMLSMLCKAILHCATICGMLCFLILCYHTLYTMLSKSFATLWYIYYAILCWAMSSWGIMCCAMLWYVICYTLLYCTMQRYIILWYGALRYDTLWYSLLYHYSSNPLYFIYSTRNTTLHCLKLCLVCFRFVFHCLKMLIPNDSIVSLVHIWNNNEWKCVFRVSYTKWDLPSTWLVHPNLMT